MLSEKGMEVKKQLEELNLLKRKIKNYKHELKELLDMGSLPQNRTYTNLYSKSRSNLSPQERYAFKIDKLEEKIINTINIAVDKETRFLEALEGLDILSHNLLMERYILGKPLNKIIREFSYSDRHIYRMFDKAIEELTDRLNK